MRIANIMLGKGKGGLEQAALSYAQALAARGHQVTTIVRPGSWAARKLQFSSQPCVELARPYSWNPFCRLRLRQLLAECDVAFVHGNRAAAFLPAKASRPKIIAVVHSRMFEDAAVFDGLIALSPAAQKDLEALRPGRPVFLVPNMIEMPAAVIRPGFHTPPVIAALGRHSLEKGFDLLVEALALLKQQDINFRAVLGGTGPETEKLQSLVAARQLSAHVEFIGWVEDKRAFFERADVFCLPSRTESFGLALLEAMAYGCPCVSTDCTGPASFVRDGDTGYLCRPDPAQIAASLKTVLQSPDAHIAMGARAQRHVQAEYALPVIAEKLDGVLSRFLAQS